MPQPILSNVATEDLSARFNGTSTVAGSPATNEEKVIATLTLSTWSDLAITSGIRFVCSAAFTAGTNGTAATMRLRQTNTSGNVVYSTGALDVTAAHLYNFGFACFDAAPGVGVYVLTLQVTGGSAGSTVSALHISSVMI